MPALLPSTNRSLLHGQVVSVHGRQYVVELAGGERLACFPRGKKSLLACGDQVEVMAIARGQGVVEAVDPRRTLLYRSDRYRQKLIAANVTQIVVVLAAVPSFYEELLNRCLVAAEHERIRALILLNKFDLEAESAQALERLRLYSELGYPVLPIIAKRDVEPLRARLEGETSVLIGQSGMGKSTIVNALLPTAGAAVGAISVALDSGRHTTTHASLYRLDAHSALIDSPGMQEFGLRHLSLDDVQRAFREFRPWLGQCRFGNCRHLSEPGCAVQAAVARNEVSELRMTVYRKLAEEALAARTRL